jgi:hypothetical protein
LGEEKLEVIMLNLEINKGFVDILSPESIYAPLFERICVRPPYFALTDISWTSPTFSARASAETDPLAERGPMSAAEIGRHAAIAGLCSIAMSMDDARRYYYLAKKARCRFFSSHAAYGTTLKFAATPQATHAREASASVVVTIGIHRVAVFDVQYARLSTELFSRLFAKHHRPTFGVGWGYQDYLPLRHEGYGEAMIDNVPEDACSGHFDDYPALPVAVLMGEFTHLAGHMLKRGFRVTQADVDAESLVWAGESVRLRVDQVLEDGYYREFDCKASVGERVVGQMRLGVVVT